ncbi:hypothetical protein COCCADRAFT_38444 [Bipolaris zeicola 26-R-13]|uniref:Uncharacterized protein n=1 Tax=Cochliobolus carbonum (strain 26-R-13) TaxID=930089 RepID=W6Y0E8_COCC2|nr:uncharacterized protein COCCADRAFT_38444 [Bipolaris zeicola 26-R-13]EUC31458.1 hypothetical protein COCCADRAFT_38444 [Bipolaris zeicola 26-R-13]
MGSSRLIIGLDYGTTYTGVSFCEISDPASEQSHVEIVQDWPSCHGKFGTREKVPSEIAYLQEGVRWGSDIPPHEKRHMWTKLELDNREDSEVAKINNELSLLESRKPPMKIIADFLEQVKTHLIKNLDDRYGKELWRTLPITLVVTVPAVWSDTAKHRTKQAVEKAMPIVLTTEPEAAALYTIKTLRGTAQDAQFAVGDGFTVCDMGGGTVDLITYRITAIQPTVIEEASVGNGAQCGGSFVDRAFLHWLERRLGTQDFVKIAGSRSEEIPRTSLNEKTAQLVQDFTMGIKCGFSGTQENYLRLPYPLSTIDGDEKRGNVFGNLKITADDVKAMFDSCLCRTYELLQEQTQRARIGNLKIKYVFMVGGFSESPYMFSKIKDFLEKQEIQAIRPPYAWSAVVRGAVTKGLEKGVGAVLKRKSRRHYGTSCARLFQKRAHKRMANNQMKWLIEKGQTLLASEATHAATGFMLRWWSVYRVAVLTVDSNDIPLVYLKRNTSPCGRQYYSINVTVHISLQSSLNFYVTIKGKKFGSLTVSYD